LQLIINIYNNNTFRKDNYLKYLKPYERLGKINKNNFGTEMKIIKVLPDDRVIVQFQDDHKFEKNIHWGNFKNGNVKNPYDKIHFNVGYFGVGNYYAISKGYRPEAYDVWLNMIRRCYCEKDRDLHPAYYNISEVCEEWHNYQVFAEWYESNKYVVEGRLHLDKDILIKGNKLYSPETCLLVPQRINMIFMTKSRKDDLPTGITKNTGGTYAAHYNGIRYGTYDSLEEAVEERDRRKRIHIKEVAEEYKDIIPLNVYESLLRW
jgi:hypothetical protein